MPHVRAAKITFDRFDRRYEIKGNERRRRERRRGCRCGCVADLLRMRSELTIADRLFFFSLQFVMPKMAKYFSIIIFIANSGKLKGFNKNGIGITFN